MYFPTESSRQRIREAPLPLTDKEKTRSRELMNSPKIPQSARGRQSGVRAGSLTDPKPGHLLLKSSAHRAHSLPPPTGPGPAQLPLPPGSPHRSIQTARLVLFPRSTLPRSIKARGGIYCRNKLRKLRGKKKSLETKARGAGGRARPSSWYLPAGSGLGSDRAGWMGWGEPKTGAPKSAWALAGSYPCGPQALLNTNLQLDFQGLGNGDPERGRLSPRCRANWKRLVHQEPSWDPAPTPQPALLSQACPLSLGLHHPSPGSPGGRERTATPSLPEETVNPGDKEVRGVVVSPKLCLCQG